MKYKVSVYTDIVSLEKELNKMYDNNYKPTFIQRSSNGYITVVYEQIN